MTDLRMDWDREARTGIAEGVIAEGKTSRQIEGALRDAVSQERRLLITRLDTKVHAALDEGLRTSLDYDEFSRTAILGGLRAAELREGIGIVAAGTSDLRVAQEAARTLVFHGYASPVIADVGVAGLWRVMEEMERIRSFGAVIAVAGMEGALFSVVAGLVAAPVIAVATSNGYGVAAGGTAALQAALASCAPGVVTVNIDNGFGAACAAIKMMRISRGS